MADLIDRQVAIDAILTINDYGNSDRANALGLAEFAITTLPTVDAVEVVRCKDCMWYKTMYSWNGKEHKVCGIEFYGPIRKDDDFCSRGERKDG